MQNTMTPRLIVRDPDAAIAFYQEALGAELVARHAIDGSVVHAELRVGEDAFTMAGEKEEWGLLSPEKLGGSASLITLHVTDARATAKSMVDHGAEVLIPIEDREYGRCEGRVRDPFGHLWIPSHPLQDPEG